MEFESTNSTLVSIYAPQHKIDEEYFKEVCDTINNDTLVIATKLQHVDIKKIRSINGIELNVNQNYHCDYCKDKCDLRTGYYCYDCHMDMCKLCHMETDENIVKSNGAKNYKMREKRLNQCRTHDLQKSIGRYICRCYDCNNVIPQFYPRYHVAGFDINFCLDCYQKFNMSKNPLFELVHDDCHIGSIKDWIIIANDMQNNKTILCNLNPDSKYYKQFAECKNSIIVGTNIVCYMDIKTDHKIKF